MAQRPPPEGFWRKPEIGFHAKELSSLILAYVRLMGKKCLRSAFDFQRFAPHGSSWFKLLDATPGLWLFGWTPSIADETAEAEGHFMEQVTGIGGVFFKARDPGRMAAWYREHLGIRAEDGHADFAWREKDRPEEIGRPVWSMFPDDTDYFGPSRSP